MKTTMTEAEDFEKIVKFKTSEFAIVDAEVIKALKNKDLPLIDKAIYVATKVSPDMDVSWRIAGKYDDASLRRLIIEPAAANEIPDDVEPINQNLDEARLDPNKGEGDPAAKVVRKIEGSLSGEMPGVSSRKYRNKGDSAKGNNKTKLTSGASSIVARVAQKGSIGAKDERAGMKGAKKGERISQNKSPSRLGTLAPSTLAASYERSNDPISEFLRKVKNNEVTENYLNLLDNKEEMREALVKLRSMWIADEVGQIDSDLLCNSIRVLEEDWAKSAEKRVQTIEEMVSRGLNNLMG